MSKAQQLRARSRRTGSLPRLDDVARMAKVSTATVSRCLNAPERVSKDTRDRVMQAVRTLGYTPNFGARALAARRTDTFGAIIPTMENAIFARGLQAFQETLERNGITLLVSSSSYSPEAEERQIRTLVARGADALLLIGQDRTDESYAFLRSQGIPFVTAWSYRDDCDHVTVGFDNRRAMQALASEILALGHRRLAFISAPRAGNDRARERHEGAVAAVRAAGLPDSALRLVETPYSIANGAEALRHILTAAPDTTAVMCGNDVLAAGALRAALQMGRRVPEDLSITGFDDIELADLTTPGLTTVHVPHRAMGQTAAERLIAVRNGDKDQTSAELPARITWRGSLVAPPGA